MLFFALVLVVMVMAVQRIEGAEDWGLVGNWELWRRGGQRTARPPPSSDDTDNDVHTAARARSCETPAEDYKLHAQLQDAWCQSSLIAQVCGLPEPSSCQAVSPASHHRQTAVELFPILHAAATDVHKQMAPMGL
jgi:hypothetical protein